MALPANGALSFNEIGIELQRASGSILNITTAETGGYVALNPYSTYKPDGVIPSSVSEWYSYNHTQVQLIPFFQIVKVAPSDVNVNTNFNFTITVTNSGTSSTNGSAVVVSDVLPSNVQFVTYNAPGWNINQLGTTIQATRNDVLASGNAYNDIIITVKIANCASGAYYNQANVYGGGTSGTQYSNTTTTNASLFSATINVTRSIQKNDCGQYCSGTYVNVTSPSFTRSSCISQGDANALATSDANNWLDANGQGVANANGSCNCAPPTYSLTKILDSATPIYVGGSMQWKISLGISGNNTSGTVTISDSIGGEFTITNHSQPVGWSYFQSGNNVSFYTSNVLTVGATYDFFITLTANQSGTFTNYATVSGGSGNNVSTNASVNISAAILPSFTNFIETNNANPVFKSSSNTYAVHLVDNNTIRHSVSFTIANASVAAYSLKIYKAYDDSLYIVGSAAYSGWTYNGTYFTNNTTLSPGAYNVGYVDYKIVTFGYAGDLNLPFLGVKSASHQFILYYNDNQITNSFSQYNTAGLVKMELRLYCTFSGVNPNWFGNYIFALELNGTSISFISFAINDFSKYWLIGPFYRTIGSGVAINGYEVFPGGFSLGNYNGSVTYKLFGQCNITNSNAIAYQWGAPYWYNSSVSIVIDFNPSTGSFITC